MIRPDEVSSGIANTPILEIGDNSLRRAFEQRHVLICRRRLNIEPPAATDIYLDNFRSRVGAMVVISGNKAGGDGIVIASPGVEEEVQIALRLGKPVIPIGVSGHVAHRVWESAIADPQQYLQGIQCDAELTILGDQSSSVEQLVGATMSLLERAEKLASKKHRAD